MLCVYPTWMPGRLGLSATDHLPSLESIWESVASLDVNAEVSPTLDIRQFSQTETIRVIYGGLLQGSLLAVEPHLRGLTPNHKHINRDLCDMCISSGFQSTSAAVNPSAFVDQRFVAEAAKSNQRKMRKWSQLPLIHITW